MGLGVGVRLEEVMGVAVLHSAVAVRRGAARRGAAREACANKGFASPPSPNQLIFMFSTFSGSLLTTNYLNSAGVELDI